jgi:hypothetical protein
VLAPLSELAEESRVAVVVVIHTKKGADIDPLMRISGSTGFTGVARSVLLAADDPQDDGRRILAVMKSNLAEYPPPLAYRLVGGTSLGVHDPPRTTSCSSTCSTHCSPSRSRLSAIRSRSWSGRTETRTKASYTAPRVRHGFVEVLLNSRRRPMPPCRRDRATAR